MLTCLRARYAAARYRTLQRAIISLPACRHARVFTRLIYRVIRPYVVNTRQHWPYGFAVDYFTSSARLLMTPLDAAR